VAAGELDEDIFEAGLARAQMCESIAFTSDGIEQSGNGEMRFADT
jgi:hypothetical protein